MENPVFARRTNLTDRTLSGAAYNLIIGLTLCWGFWVNWWMVANIPVESIRSIHPLLFFGGYFASCMAGVYLFQRSNQPWVSFVGYNLVVVPFGLVVNLVVSRYDASLVQDAIRITAWVTVAMMVAGTLFPRFFAKISGALTVALLAVIVVELVEVFILGIHHGVLDWIVVLIFCGYIGLDWGRANQIPKTFDNAIDSAAALYMDIINLFLRILRILGRK
jgi:FtsH-binding integral membrane protein